MNLNLNTSKAFEALQTINEFYKTRICEVKRVFRLDNDVYQITYNEWVQMLQKYSVSLIELIDDLFQEATRKLNTLERINKHYALQLSRNTDLKKSQISFKTVKSSRSNVSQTEKRICLLHSEDKSYLDILNKEVCNLLKISQLKNEHFKIKRRRFSCQKDKILKLVNSLITRISIGQQRLQKFMNAIQNMNELLCQNTNVYESDSSVFQDLRTKILEMQTENQCLKDQIQVLRVDKCDFSNQTCIQKPRIPQDLSLTKENFSKIQCDLKMKNERIERLRQNNIHLQKELKKANCKTFNFENKLKEESDKVQKLLEENCNLAKSLKSPRNDDRTSEVDNLLEILFKKEAEICTLKEKIEEQGSKTEKSLEMCNKWTECDAENTIQQEEIYCLEKMNSDKNQALQMLNTKLKSTLGELESKSLELIYTKSKVCELEKELNKSKEQFECFQELLNKSQTMNEEQLIETEHLNKEISVLNSKICSLKGCIEEMSSAKSEKIEQQTKKLKSEISSLKSSNLDLSKENEGLKQKLQDFEKSSKEKSSIKECLEKEVCSLKDKLQKQVSKSNESTCKYNSLVEEYNEMQEEFRNASCKLRNAMCSIDNFQKEDDSKSQKIRHLEKHLQSMTKEKEKLVAYNCQLKQLNQKLINQCEQCCCNF